MKLFFPQSAFKILSLSLGLSSLIIVSWLSFLRYFWSLGFIELHDLWVYSLHQNWKLFSPYFVQIFFSVPFLLSFRDPNYWHAWPLEVVLWLTNALFCCCCCCCFLNFCFSVFHCEYSSLTFSSAIFNQPLIPSIVFFIVYLVFNL